MVVIVTMIHIGVLRLKTFKKKHFNSTCFIFIVVSMVKA